jgi:uncharacterized protein YecT (DUF1311 family)
MNKLFLTLIFLSLTVNLLSQDSKTKDHPIDLKCKQCLEADSSKTTAGMIKCEIVAAQEWDQELNKYYKLLLSVLNPDEKEKIKSSQVQWLKYRDNENTFSQTLYNNMQGTMWRVANASRRTEIIKQRALELKD